MFVVNVVDATVTLEGIVTPPLLQQSADRLRKLMIDAGLSQSGKANPRYCGWLTKGANIADAADKASLHKSSSIIIIVTSVRTQELWYMLGSAIATW